MLVCFFFKLELKDRDAKSKANLERMKQSVSCLAEEKYQAQSELRATLEVRIEGGDTEGEIWKEREYILFELVEI